MFPEDKHLETYLVSNQKDQSPQSVTNITVTQYIWMLAISIPITVAISLTLLERLLDFNLTLFEIENPFRIGINPDYVPPRPPGNPPPEGPLPPNSPVLENPTVTPDIPRDPGEGSPRFIPPIYPDGYWIHIPSSCNGFYAGGGNFRANPSLDASVIKGVVPAGARVFLTGEKAHGDSIIWHRAINEALLERSIEHGALNFLTAEQEGWIANCFVEQL